MAANQIVYPSNGYYREFTNHVSEEKLKEIMCNGLIKHMEQELSGGEEIEMDDLELILSGWMEDININVEIDLEKFIVDVINHVKSKFSFKDQEEDQKYYGTVDHNLEKDELQDRLARGLIIYNATHKPKFTKLSKTLQLWIDNDADGEKYFVSLTSQDLEFVLDIYQVYQKDNAKPN